MKKLPFGNLYVLQNSLSNGLEETSLKFKIILVNTKKGKSIGKTLKAHTLRAFKHEEEYNFGLDMSIKHIIISNNVINLFDFRILIIYNNIRKMG